MKLLKDAPNHSSDAVGEDIYVLEEARRSFLDRYAKQILPVLTLVVFLTVWEALGQFGYIAPLFFSWPSEIVQSLIKAAGSNLLNDLRISGIEFVFGYALSLVAIPMGLAIGYWRKLEYAADPFVSALYATPMVALTPLFVIWFGLGIASKVVVVALLAYFPLLINTAEGVKTVDTELREAAASFGANRLQGFIHVVLPGSLPFIVTGLRLAIGKALIGVVIGEFIGSIGGIGYRIRAAAETFRTHDFIAHVIILMVLSIMLTAMLRALEHKIAPWGVRATE